jgi:glutamyl-tRNA synthetase
MPFDELSTAKIKSIALRNAVEYDGKANVNAVIAKVASQMPELRTKLKEIVPEITKIVQDVNRVSLNDQKNLLKSIESSETINDITVKHSILPPSTLPHLPPLINAKMGEVVTRFPPEPNGYPHIGHAKAAIIDQEYALMYEGKLILRFDDTNPLNEKIEYYSAISEGLEWLGIKPNIVKNTSDDLTLLYEYGKRLILQNDAYVCTCSQTIIHDLRSKGLDCECRTDSSAAIERSKKMFDGSFDQQDAIIRFKGDMSSSNTAMRDPTLFRIIDAYHPRLGNKYRVWPTYDFATPIEDSIDGVTHAMRTKEYELRNPLYFSILDKLNLRKPAVLEFSRLEFNNMPVSKRKIKALVEERIIQSWDDPRLPTLMGIRRRGFSPEAIRKFVLSLGLTLAETKPPFETLEAFNRKIIDKNCIRLFFVNSPVEIQVTGILPSDVVLKNHPNIDLGCRKIHVADTFFIARDDAVKLNIGDQIRLIELYNIKIAEIKYENNNLTLLIGVVAGDEIKKDIPKVQWVAKDDAIPYKIMIPRDLYIGDKYNRNSLQIAIGFAESFVSNIKADNRIQFVRFGFCRVDSDNTAIFTHR